MFGVVVGGKKNSGSPDRSDGVDEQGDLLEQYASDKRDGRGFDSFRAWLWDLRRLVSLLLDHGHPHARRYPLGMLYDEARLVNVRLNRHHVTQASLIQSAVGALLDKKAGRHWKKAVADLTEE